MSQSQIIHLASGYVNSVNDAVIGMPSAPGGTGASKFAGQLGKQVWWDDSQVKYQTGGSNLPAVYGGWFQYVRLAAASAVPIPGQILFWDTLANAADNLFQVTTAENGSTDTAMLRAGICLTPTVTVGNYTLIQVEGPCYVKFRAALTSAGAAGSRVFCAAAGGADLGFADVIDSANPVLFSDASKLMGRWIGVAQEAPAAGALKRVYVNFRNLRG
jgi:hypothetical protein